jgi:hypothetical protein
MNTAATSESSATAVVPHTPIYTAPAAHAFEIAPAAHNVFLAPAGHVYTGPAQQSSGIGIHADHSA